MRAWPLLSLLPLVAIGCAVRAPRAVGFLPISAKVTIRAEANVQATTSVQAAAVPQTIVAIQNAPVVEFFGVPLEGATDAVFVLDISGSMDEVAQGAIARYQPAPPPAAPAPPSQSPADAQGGVTVGPAPGASTPPPAQTDAPPPPPPAAPSAPRKIDVAKSELIDALQRLPAGTNMNVVFFNSDVDGFSPTMFTLDETNRANLVAYVGDMEPAGSTALAPAMRVAFLMNAKRIVLLSDGLGNVGGTSESLMRDAREAIRGGVRIDTIGLGAGQDRRLLSSLAQESGGLYQPL